MSQLVLRVNCQESAPFSSSATNIIHFKIPVGNWDFSNSYLLMPLQINLGNGDPLLVRYLEPQSGVKLAPPSIFIRRCALRLNTGESVVDINNLHILNNNLEFYEYDLATTKTLMRYSGMLVNYDDLPTAPTSGFDANGQMMLQLPFHRLIHGFAMDGVDLTKYGGCELELELADVSTVVIPTVGIDIPATTVNIPVNSGLNDQQLMDSASDYPIAITVVNASIDLGKLVIDLTADPWSQYAGILNISEFPIGSGDVLVITDSAVTSKAVTVSLNVPPVLSVANKTVTITGATNTLIVSDGTMDRDGTAGHSVVRNKVVLLNSSSIAALNDFGVYIGSFIQQVIGNSGSGDLETFRIANIQLNGNNQVILILDRVSNTLNPFDQNGADNTWLYLRQYGIGRVGLVPATASGLPSPLTPGTTPDTLYLQVSELSPVAVGNELTFYNTDGTVDGTAHIVQSVSAYNENVIVVTLDTAVDSIVDSAISDYGSFVIATQAKVATTMTFFAPWQVSLKRSMSKPVDVSKTGYTTWINHPFSIPEIAIGSQYSQNLQIDPLSKAFLFALPENANFFSGLEFLSKYNFVLDGDMVIKRDVSLATDDLSVHYDKVSRLFKNGLELPTGNIYEGKELCWMTGDDEPSGPIGFPLNPTSVLDYTPFQLYGGGTAYPARTGYLYCYATRFLS